MKYLALAMAAFFSISAAAQNYKPNLPIETVSSEMSSIEKKVRDAAVKITVPFTGGHGSGSYIKYKDIYLVITAQHVANGSLGTNYLITHKDESHLGTLIYADELNDIALLYVANNFDRTEPITFRPLEEPAIVGTEIYYSGFPSHHKLMSFQGRVAGYESGPGIGKHIILQTYGWFGCSGSVVYDSKGRIIGVLYGIDVEYNPSIQVQENMIWVVPINKMPINKALAPFCRGAMRNHKACRL
jgi:S1-C subfamily serine protease